MRLTRKKQFKKPESFDELLLDDPFGLLNNVGEKRLSMSVSDKIKAAFEEVAEFVKKNQRLPSIDTDDFDEELLAERFNSLIKDAPEGKAYCESFLAENKDKNVLEGIHIFNNNEDNKLAEHIDQMESKAFNSVDDIFNDDPFGLLSNVGDKAVEPESWKKNKTQTASIDGVVTRASQCHDFYRYQRYFNEIERLLTEGHLEGKNIVGDSASILLGDIFVIDGMMSIISEADVESAQYDSSKSKLRYRVKQIFANGTESRPFSTSIKSSFYKSDPPCKRIVSSDHIGIEFLETMREELKKAETGSVNAIMTGYIYILSSKSNHPVIKKFTEGSNLVKIGYCTTDVATRIANAAKDPTYLCAPVNVLKTFKCYNFDPRNLEDVLHSILANHKLNVELKDSNGSTFKPREWFTVSVQTASDIVEHLFAGDIANYYIDSIQGKLKRK